MIRKHIIKEGADWWKIFANRISKEASNKAIENGCNKELVNNLLNNSNIFVEKNGDGYVLFNNNDIICKVPKTSSFDDMVVMSINGLTNWITTKLNKNNLIESINVDNNQEPKNATIKVNFNAYYSEKSKKFDGGLYPILEYIKDNKLKNVIVRLDYDKKNTTSWDEVDLYCSELSIKKLSFSISDTYPKYTAYIECNRKYVRFLIKMLIQMASLGNGGHSYGILINDKQFNFDGDGADHISSINDITLNKKVYSDINKQIDIYNKSLNNDKNMNENKKQIKLTESEFKALIKESVSKILKEHDLMPGDNGGYFSTSEYNNSKNNTWRGVVGTRFIWHGEWADPEVEYDGELLNANELDDYAWDVYKDTICSEQGTKCSEEEFNNLPSDWFAEIIEDYTMNNYIS